MALECLQDPVPLDQFDSWVQCGVPGVKADLSAVNLPPAAKAGAFYLTQGGAGAGAPAPAPAELGALQGTPGPAAAELGALVEGAPGPDSAPEQLGGAPSPATAPAPAPASRRLLR